MEELGCIPRRIWAPVVGETRNSGSQPKQDIDLAYHFILRGQGGHADTPWWENDAVCNPFCSLAGVVHVIEGVQTEVASLQDGTEALTRGVVVKEVTLTVWRLN